MTVMTVMDNMDNMDNIDNMDKKSETTIPAAVVSRLPRYYRMLASLLDEGVYRISSRDLASLMGVTASQIRQDLHMFGEFGQQGYGYNVKYLLGKIGEILGVDEAYSAVIIGAGVLGRAIAESSILVGCGIFTKAIFDTDIDTDIDTDTVHGEGETVGGCPICKITELESFFAENRIDLAVIAPQIGSERKYAERLRRLGVKGIWNLGAGDIPSYEGVSVKNSYPGDALMTLCCDVRMAMDKKTKDTDKGEKGDRGDKDKDE